MTAVNLLEYADDCAIVAHSEAGLQSTLNLFVDANKRLGLSLNINKTKVLHQPAPGQLSPAPKILIGGQELENVEHFAYLDSHFSQKANIDNEIHHRMKCESSSSGRLLHCVFNDHDLRTHTKLLVYSAVVIP